MSSDQVIFFLQGVGLQIKEKTSTHRLEEAIELAAYSYNVL